MSVTAVIAILAAAINLAPLPAASPGHVPAGTDPVPWVEVSLTADGAERILEAEELAMLPQRIATDACAWLAGIDGAEADLRMSVAKFDRVIDALTYGDEGLGIHGPETSRKLMVDLEKVHAVWDPLHEVLDGLLAGSPAAEDVLHIAEASLELLKVGKHLAEMEVAEYADPFELTLRDALAIEIAGRQEVLAEEIAKDLCLLFVHLGDPAAEREEMIGAIEMFEITLRALHDGMPEAGLAPPPTKEIVQQLEGVEGEWAETRPILTRIAAGGEPTFEETTVVFHNMMRVTDHMAEVIHLYADASHMGH